MSQPSIEVVVHTDGRIEIDAVGYEGNDCEKATSWLERALGLFTSRKRKPEYHRRRTRNKYRQKLGGGEGDA